MSEYADMEEFLESKTPEPETEPEVEEEGTQQEPEEATGEEAEPETAEKQEDAPPVSEEKQPSETERQLYAYQKAMEDERRKRQEYEKKIQEYEKKNEEKPDFWEDPESVISQRVQDVEQRLTQQYQSDRLNLSEDLAKQKYQDYEEKFQVFSQMVQRDPSIYQQMLKQGNPAEYAYRSAKRLLDIQQMGDPDSYRQKVESELREKLKEELKQEYEQKVQQTNSLPESFSEKTSKKAPKGQFAGPTSLESILN